MDAASATRSTEGDWDAKDGSGTECSINSLPHQQDDAQIELLQTKVGKLERLYALTKKKLDDTLAQAAEEHKRGKMPSGDIPISGLNEVGYVILQRVAVPLLQTESATISQHWCFVANREELARLAAEDAETSTKLVAERGVPKCGWALQATISQFMPSCTSFPLSVPASDLKSLRSTAIRARDEREAANSKSRNLRIKYETLLRQKDNQIQELQEQVAQLQQRAISTVDAGKDLSAKEALVTRLSASNDELGKEVEKHKDTIRQLRRDLASASDNVRMWRSKFEEAVSAAEQRARAEQGEGAGAALASLQEEYATYRKRALEIIAKKDRELHQLAMAAGKSTTVVAGGPVGLDGTGPVPLDSTKKEYLKNTVLRYMLTSDAGVKTHLESAIAGMLDLTPAEREQLKAHQTARASWW